MLKNEFTFSQNYRSYNKLYSLVCTKENEWNDIRSESISEVARIGIRFVDYARIIERRFHWNPFHPTTNKTIGWGTILYN